MNINELIKKSDVKEIYDALKEAKKTYDDGNAIISDADYDILEAHFLDINPGSDFFDVVETSVNGFEKVEPVMIMSSLDKTKYDEENGGYTDLEKWFKKFNEDVCVTPKMDGCSVELVYESGILKRAVTRGKDNMTVNAQLIKSIPKRLKEDVDIAIRGEIFLKISEFNKLIQTPEGQGYSNPRNLASGSIKQHDAKIVRRRNLSFWAHDCQNIFNVKIEEEKLNELEKLGIPVVPSKRITNISDLKIFLEKSEEKRGVADYEIDGMVIKSNSLDLQKELGHDDNGKRNPKYSVAFKFKAAEKNSFFKGFKFQVGWTGKITPVAIIEPIELGGVIVKSPTLHNWKRVLDLGLTPGCEIIVSRRGDVIPQVEGVIGEKGISEAPTHCPSCKEEIIFDGVFLICENPNCEAKIYKTICHQVEILEIDSLGHSWVNKFIDEGYVKNISDVFRLKDQYNSLVNLDGAGDTSVKKILDNIDGKRKLSLGTLLDLTCIPNVGTSASNEIADKVGTFENLKALDVNELQKLNLENFGTVRYETLKRHLPRMIKLIQDILDAGVEIKKDDEVGGDLNGKSYCFTGALETMKRKEAEKLVASKGGRIGSVKKGLTYLVTNDTGSGSAKNRKANELGIEIINEKEFLEMVK